MNARELVLDTLAKRERDIMPWQLDLTDEVHARLAAHFGDPDFESRLGNALAQERNEIITPIGGALVRDMYDIVWRREYKGDFGVVEDYPLKEADFGSYRFPVPDAVSIRAKCERLVARRDRQYTMYIIGFSLFERAWALRSMPELLIDFLINPDFVDELFRRVTDYNLAVIDLVAEYPIDCIFFGDDWGQQSGLIMGPGHWRRFIKPSLERMYSHVAAKGMTIAQHSCGDVHEVFDDLVDLGLAIYNTFQPEVYDVEFMKRRYGSNVTFYGGISTQRLLPFATPEEVKRETRRLMGILGKGGGYIIAPTHSIPDDVPTENILALLEVMQGQGEGAH